MGLNEFAGYLAVAASAWATGWLAAVYGPRPAPFWLGVAVVVAGFLLSVLAVKDTSAHVAHETRLDHGQDTAPAPGDVFWRTSIGDRDLSIVSQAGLVNNLNDGVAWGLFPLLFAGAGLDLAQVGALAALYPAVWGVLQLATGALSDRLGRKRLIVAGLWLQAAAIGGIALSETFAAFAWASALLGAGTAMVYPTLLAAVGDVARPSWRASAVGVYRFWRDLGYAVGAVLAGLTADAFGMPTALATVAALTFLSGLAVAVRMTTTLGLTPRNARAESAGS